MIDYRYIISNLLNKVQFYRKKHNILVRLDRAEIFGTTLHVRGWAISRRGYSDILRIDAFLDNQFIGPATYGEHRLDVKQAYPTIKEGERSGFHLTVDLADSGTTYLNAHFAITIKAIGSEHEICTTRKRCQKSATCVALPVVALQLPPPERYQQWYNLNQCPAQELAAQSQEALTWEQPPLLSIIIPLFNSQPQWLDELLQSIHQQSYPFWECLLVDDASRRTEHFTIINQWLQQDSRCRLLQHPINRGVSNTCQTGVQEARGDYVCIIDHDDLVEPQAFFEIARSIGADAPDVIYSDEMLIDEDGHMIRCEFRPDFNYHFLLSHPYIVHLTAFKRELVVKVGGFTAGLQISQDYDLLLRIAAVTRSFHHIPKVLYRWRTHQSSTGHRFMSRVMSHSLNAINQHLRLVGLQEDDAWAEHGKSFNAFRVRYRIRPTRISVIIPTKNQQDFLKKCLSSFQRITRIPKGIEIEFIIIDNGSTAPEMLTYLEELKQTGCQVIRIDAPFNFSMLNNRAVAQATGSLLLFMNNDIEIIEPEWLEAMVELMSLPDVAVVGAKLLYPDNHSIQHAGVILGFNGTAAHDHQFYPESDHNHNLTPGHNAALLAIRECLAVTAACMLVRRSIFQEVGGFDECLQVGYGDTDLCLKIRAHGSKILFTPHARLIHHESASRGYQDADSHVDDTVLFAQRWAEQIQAGDPFYNRNLMREVTLFEPELTPPKKLFRQPWLFTSGSPLQKIDFQCNICGSLNENIPVDQVNNREAQSCRACHSSLRMRAIMYALSMEIFGESLILPEMPFRKNLRAIGMSDWEGYAGWLTRRFSYTNTFYHTQPKLDITQIDDSQENRYDFIISSDVFEHIPHPVSVAFRNLYRLLKPGGCVIFTVPYKKEGETDEYFPELFDFQIVSEQGQRVLINRTKDGRTQRFDNVTFHGGDGATLEMRMFSEQSLYQEFQKAQFDSVKIYGEDVADFGILWPINWALPMVARKPKILKNNNSFTSRIF
ncbi:glycosyltransferase [candidate division KSB1 bacterium]|nr:glycosyltransferase [candidate division KSB1 bacterium]